MKITVLWVGRARDPSFLALQEEYARRIRGYCDLKLVAVKSSGRPEAALAMEAEAVQLMSQVQSADTVVALDAAGTLHSSEGFARFLSTQMERPVKNLLFLIGGSFGLSSKVKTRADYILSLSRLTFSHELARVLLLEQVYRAFTLLHHHPYHK
ncbi:MAG: 23S rRNA (pseudouridine(1915)-N(3))-methyltransferase RlmH [Acidobacteriota bacterium]